MLEAIVVLVCLYGSGCTETRDAYLYYNPQMHEQAEKIQTEIKNRVGERTVKYATPLISSFAAHQLVVPLGGIYFKTNFDSYSINFGTSF